jgi:hypothetical protein
MACDSQQLLNGLEGVVHPVISFLMLHSIDEMSRERQLE